MLFFIFSVLRRSRTRCRFRISDMRCLFLMMFCRFGSFQASLLGANTVRSFMFFMRTTNSGSKSLMASQNLESGPSSFSCAVA